jgi:hypothetical protein
MAAIWGFNYSANVILSTVSHKNYNITEDLNLNLEKFVLGSSNKLQPGTTQ